jgi:hypothetical protein
VAKVFLSPYMSNHLGKDNEHGCAKSYAPLHDALRRGEWPYDYGDDPSFFCRRHRGGALTWGVCRADVRSQVQPGDVVVFFSFTKAGRQVKYRLSAIATVQTKLQQSDIFTNPLYKRYRRYLNLLVRRSRSTKGAWEHWEPGAPEQEWHDDWLSRIVPYRYFSKTELKRQGATHRVSSGSLIDGKRFMFGDNYVLFSDDPSQTLVLERPPTVAFSEPPRAEVWCNDQLSRGVFKRTVEQAKKYGVGRSLRLDNKSFQPHSPPIRWKVGAESIDEWREDFLRFLSDRGLC